MNHAKNNVNIFDSLDFWLKNPQKIFQHIMKMALVFAKNMKKLTYYEFLMN